MKKCGGVDLTFFRQGNQLSRSHAHFPKVTIKNVPGVVNQENVLADPENFEPFWAIMLTDRGR